MSASDILVLTRIFREQVAARESVAVDQIVAAYQLIYAALEEQLNELLTLAAARRQSGQDVSPAWVSRQEALEVLLDQVERQIEALLPTAENAISAGQRDLIQLGQQHGEQLIRAGLGTPPPSAGVRFSRFNPAAVETMVGFLTPGTPLRDALDRLPEMASQDVRDALVRGIGTGQHPRVVARSFREAIGGNLASAEKLARTTQLNAYRSSTRQSFAANPDIVTGWRWIARVDSPRTCMSCIVKHGQVFPLDEEMRDHWRGRCGMAAVTKSWAELGFADAPDTRPQIETGIDWFTRQPPAVQREHLGRSKYHAWKAGEFDLADLSVAHNDPIWGEMFQEASLISMVGEERARTWYARSAAIEREALAAAG